MVRRRRIKEVVFTRVIVGENVAKQHRMVVSWIIIWTKRRKALKSVKRIKSWKPKDPKVKNRFTMEVIESGILGGQKEWQRVIENDTKHCQNRTG